MEIYSIYHMLAVICGFVMAWGIGANDVSNAMGTSVGSKAISIRQAILIAAIFEFLGAFFAGGEVTTTIKNDLLTIPPTDNHIDVFCIGMLSSLLASSCWLLIASIRGWPVSTTHTIVGAILGFGIVNVGVEYVHWEMVGFILIGWICSPLLGAVIAYVLYKSVRTFIFETAEPLKAARKVVPYYIFLCAWSILAIIFSRIHTLFDSITMWHANLAAFMLSILIMLVSKIYISGMKVDKQMSLTSHHVNVEKIFMVLMIFTACAMAFAHGSNDVSNAIGPLSSVISVLNPSIKTIPIWVLLIGASGIVIGLATYGHKVIATVGTKITHLTPSRGFSATLAAAVTVLMASNTGLPISTTHTLVGAILGIGLVSGLESINLAVIRSICMSWFITFPSGAILAIIFYKIMHAFFYWYKLT
jgi:PiT family inorganic phosphate transporter